MILTNRFCNFRIKFKFLKLSQKRIPYLVFLTLYINVATERNTRDLIFNKYSKNYENIKNHINLLSFFDIVASKSYQVQKLQHKHSQKHLLPVILQNVKNRHPLICLHIFSTFLKSIALKY